MQSKFLICLFVLLSLTGVKRVAYAAEAGLPWAPSNELVWADLGEEHKIDAWKVMFAHGEDANEPKLNNWKSGLWEAILPFKSSLQKPTVDAVFRSLREKYLISYQEGVGVDETFATGAFNCLSGSALVGLGMEMMGWKVQFIAEPTHVYLTVHDGRHWYRLETTEDDFGAIRCREPKKSDQLERIDWIQLAGLQQYNSGLMAMDAGDLVAASNNFKVAHDLYPCQRVSEMQQVVGNQCVERARVAYLGQDWQAAAEWTRLANLSVTLTEIQQKVWVSALLNAASSMEDLGSAFDYLSKAAQNPNGLVQQPLFAVSLAEVGLAYSIEQFLDPDSATKGLEVLSEVEGLVAMESLPIDQELTARAYRLALLKISTTEGSLHADKWLDKVLAMEAKLNVRDSQLALEK